MQSCLYGLIKIALSECSWVKKIAIMAAKEATVSAVVTASFITEAEHVHIMNNYFWRDMLQNKNRIMG